MKGIVFLGNEKCGVREFPDPQPKAGQVLIRMKASGICGSDLWRYKMTPSRLKHSVIPGHEPCGTVEAIGHGVRNVNVGKRVSVYHLLACGHCKYCLSGDLMFCSDYKAYGQDIDGSHADFLITEERNVLPLPEELSFVDGAIIACGAGTAYSALRKLGVSGRDTLIIFGQGPVGLSGLMFAKTMGARVICVEPSLKRQQLAEELGADAVINPDEGKVSPIVTELTGGEGADLCLVTTGNSDARKEAIASLSKGGRVVFVGVGNRMDKMDFSHILWRQLTIMGSFIMPIHMYWDIVRFLIDEEISLERIVTHRFSIRQADEAFKLFAERKTGKVVFEWP